MAEKELTDKEIAEMLPHFEAQERLFSNAVQGMRAYTKLRRLLPSLEEQRQKLYGDIAAATEDLKIHEKKILERKLEMEKECNRTREQCEEQKRQAMVAAEAQIIELKQQVEVANQNRKDAEMAMMRAQQDLESSVEKHKNVLLNMEKDIAARRQVFTDLEDGINQLRAKHGLT